MNLYEPDQKELEKIYKIIKDIYVGQYQKRQQKKKGRRMMMLYQEYFTPRNTTFRFGVCVRDGKTIVSIPSQPDGILVSEDRPISIEVGLVEPLPRDIPAKVEIIGSDGT